MSGLAGRSTLIRALHSGHRSTQDVVIHIPHADVFRFGDSNKASPVLKDVDWTVNEGEIWAVVGYGSGGPKTAVLQVRRIFWNRNSY
jgi:ABC-type molybdenum transport system ATPase subunit/photorepair protein PhrA